MNIALVISAVACPTRLRILQLVGEQGLCVAEVASEVHTARSTASYHLSLLLRAGLVERSKRGRERVYRWGPERVPLLWERVPRQEGAPADSSMQRVNDRATRRDGEPRRNPGRVATEIPHGGSNGVAAAVDDTPIHNDTAVRLEPLD